MLLTLVLKDLLIEFRARTAITFVISLSLMLSVVLALGVNSAFLGSHEINKLFPALIWIVFFLTSVIVLAKSFDSELENRAIDGLLLAGVSPSVFYLSKVIVNFIISFTGHAISFFALSLLLNINIAPIFFQILLVSVLVLLAFSALACITVYIAASSPAKALLLPLILIPLLFPCYFSALELSYMIFLTNRLDFSSYWLSLLIALDVIYIVLGLNFFHSLLKS